MIKRLNYRQWEKLFSALSVLHSDIEPESLGERCIAAMNNLVSAEITAFDFFTDKGFHTGKYFYDPPDAISQDLYEIFTHVAHEHPFTPDVFGKRRFDAMKTSDFLTTQQFHRTAIYNEFFKLCGVDNQLLIAFSDAPGSIVTCNVSRNKNDFSEEERLIANLISQHLEAAFLNAHKIERFYKTEMTLNAALKSKSSGVIVLKANGQIVYESEFARCLLEKYFIKEKSKSGALPDDLGRWLHNECSKFRNDKIPLPARIFNVEKDAAKLEVRLMLSGAAQEITLLIEETLNPILKALNSLNLTRRETEILFWIAQGKTNKEIGLLLGISSRTVNKHADNIYTKLGVETRTAATSIALSELRVGGQSY